MSKSKTPSLEAVIEVLANDLTFLPSYEQRKAKSRFWSRFSDNPICAPADITLAVALRFVDDSRMSRWWGAEGFKEWFRNQEEFRERIESMVYLATDALERILVSGDPKSFSAQVNAAKLLMEIGRRMPPKQTAEKFLDAAIGEMDKKQLDDYIKKLLPPSKAVDKESDS